MFCARLPPPQKRPHAGGLELRACEAGLRFVALERPQRAGKRGPPSASISRSAVFELEAREHDSLRGLVIRPPTVRDVTKSGGARRADVDTFRCGLRAVVPDGAVENVRHLAGARKVVAVRGTRLRELPRPMRAELAGFAGA